MPKNLKIFKMFKEFIGQKELVKQTDNIVNLKPLKEPDKALYKKRKYITWTDNEIKKIDKYINSAKGRPVNVARIEKSMPYRSGSGIRSKVWHRCAILQKPYATTYNKKENR